MPSSSLHLATFADLFDTCPQPMKLNEKEAAVLACAELRADASMEVLCRETGLREHVIRHALRRLRERQIITPVPFINLHRIGLTIYSVYFTASFEGGATKQSLIKSLVSSPDILWVGEFGGEYQYGMAFCAQRLPHLLEFLRTLSKRHKSIFFEKAVSVQISSTIFPRRYLSRKRFNVEPVTVTFDKDVVEIDETDTKILSALTTHSDLSHRQLALKVQIPLSTVELRLRKLKDRKVIAAEILFVDPAAFDRQSYKLLVYTKGLDPQLTSQMHKFCAQHEDISYLIECFGSWGFEIGVEVARADQVSVVMQELYEHLGSSINTIKLLTKFRYPKVRWFPGASS